MYIHSYYYTFVFGILLITITIGIHIIGGFKIIFYRYLHFFGTEKCIEHIGFSVQKLYIVSLSVRKMHKLVFKFLNVTTDNIYIFLKIVVLQYSSKLNNNSIIL